LETAAHVDDSGLPLNKYLVEIQVPDSVWALREELVLKALPPTWGSIPAGAASVEIGSRWLSSLRSPLLIVPSVIVPEESASLINPRHPEATGITAKAVRRFEYNRLFRG
jgi:RES domain-containing protein